MSYRIPIYEDDLDFADREGWLWDDMDRHMDMGSRRHHRDWEDELDMMQRDFFNRKPNLSRDKRHSMPVLSGRRIPVYTTDLNDTKAVIEKDQNGCPVYRARFNVKEYKPHEISVKMDKNKIIVSAKHEEKDGTKSVSTEFNREVTIPKEVDPLSLQCMISQDGILTVDAPIPVPGYQPSLSNKSTAPPSIETNAPSQTSVSGPKTSHTSTFSTFISPSNSNAQTNTSGTTSSSGLKKQSSFSPQSSISGDSLSSSSLKKQSSLPSQSSVSEGNNSSSGLRKQTSFSPQNSVTDPNDLTSVANLDRSTKYKVEIDIEDFTPEELTVKTVDKKLVVNAMREERIGTRSSTKELNRQLTLPDTVDPNTVKAFFSENGKLFLEAPYL